MNITQALTKVRRILGPKATIRENRNAPVGDARTAALEAAKAARQAREDAQRRMHERTDALQKADPEYQQAFADWKAAGAALRREPGPTERRYSAGLPIDIGFGPGLSVKAQADTLAELVAETERRYKL
jgi:flagellar biosynthesis GTPase FlhF